jgi:PAS domain S-box-containing protein
MLEKRSFFLPDHQETGKIAQNIDWSNHPLGPAEDWCPCLKITLSSLFNTKHAVCLFWSEENYFFYNDAYIPVMGKNKHPEAMGMRGKDVWREVWNLIHPQIQDVMENGHASWHENQLVPIIRDGKSLEAYFTYSYSPVIDENGNICGTLVISTETTETLRSERALEDANARFKVMSESLPQLVWTCLADGYCDYLSKQWVEYTGISEVKQLGYEWLDLVIHPEDRDRTLKHWLGAVRGEHPYDIEYRIRRFDGVYRWFKVRGSPYKDDAGAINYWLGTCTDIEDAKQAQLNYEKNVDLSPAILWITEADGYCSYLSKQWFELTGQSELDGLGYSWFEAAHPDDREKAGLAFSEALKNHTVFRVEYRLLTKDGTYRWVIDAGNPRFDSEGKYLGMSGTVFDVHETKLAEEAFKNSQEALYRIIMQAPAAVGFLKGPKLVFDLVNTRYLELISRDETIINKSAREVMPELEETSHKLLEDVFKTGKAFSAMEYEASIRRGDKIETCYFNFIIERIIGTRGEPEGIMVVAVEVTDQVKARRANEELRLQLETIIQNMGDGLILADATGKILRFNAQALKLHGFCEMKEVLRHLDEYPSLFKVSDIEGNELPQSKWPLSRVLAGDNYNNFEVNVERLDTGKKLIINYTGARILDQNGKLSMAVLTVRDVTTRIEAEKKLRSAVNARDEFLSIASHELKTPLTSLKLQIQTTKRRIHKGLLSDLTNEKLLELFQKNESQVDRLVRLVDDMLDLSRVQSGRLTYNFRSYDLCNIIREIADRFKEQFEYAQSKLIVKSCESALGYFDKDRIEQVIINLLTNALKYGLSNPVEIRTSVKKSLVRIEVQDRGLGIEADNFEKIFQRFERVVSASEISGLGIGLFITKDIVNAHHGKIWVESEVGNGSTFIVELPLTQPTLVCS